MTRLAFPTSYPARPPFFALHFLRLLGRSGAIHDLGTDGAWLLTEIVLTEDRVRYGKAVRFSGQMFQDRFGWSKTRLVAVRRTCVEQGWLHYEPGTRRKSGLYWVTVPDWADRLDTVDEMPGSGLDSHTEQTIGTRNETQSATQSATQSEPPSIPDPRSRSHHLRSGGGGRSRPRRTAPDQDPEETPTDDRSRPAATTTLATGLRDLSPTVAAPATQRRGQAERSGPHGPDGRRRGDDPAAAAADTRSVGGDGQRARTAADLDPGDLVHTLLAAGVHRAVETLRLARTVGLTDDAIRAVLDHYRSRPGAWGPGALVQRLTSPSAALLEGPAAGWPPPSPQEARQRETTRLRDTETLRRAKSVQEARQRAAEAARWQQLELDFGPRLDALPRHAQADLLPTPFLRTLLHRQGPTSALVRRELLTALAALDQRYAAPSN